MKRHVLFKSTRFPEYARGITKNYIRTGRKIRAQKNPSKNNSSTVSRGQYGDLASYFVAPGCYLIFYHSLRIRMLIYCHSFTLQCRKINAHQNRGFPMIHVCTSSCGQHSDHLILVPVAACLGVLLEPVLSTARCTVGRSTGTQINATAVDAPRPKLRILSRPSPVLRENQIFFAPHPSIGPAR